MAKLESFPPIESAQAQILILGSMPGELSLQQQQYYAHPRNAFWYIMSCLLGFDLDVAYAERIKILKQHKIALWDVLASCQRHGSLDSAIKQEYPNDFVRFYAQHTHIKWVFFNGAKAEQSYTKHVLSVTTRKLNFLKYRRLPSTSPAMAMLTKEQKLAQWRVILEKY